MDYFNTTQQPIPPAIAKAVNNHPSMTLSPFKLGLLYTPVDYLTALQTPPDALLIFRPRPDLYAVSDDSLSYLLIHGPFNTSAPRALFADDYYLRLNDAI